MSVKKIINNKLHITKNAFSLSESLMSLAILGMIASMTIPQKLIDYQKTETAAKLKKTYATFSNAVDLSIVQNGDPSTWELSQAWSSGEEDIERYIEPYFRVEKSCDAEKLIAKNECMPYKPKGKKTQGSKGGNGADYTTFVLTDGTIVAMTRGFDYSDDRTKYIYSIIIDINGEKGPNKWGIDIFSMGIFPEVGLRPWDYYNNRSSNISACLNGSAGTSDTGCLSVIMKDGWQISTDYIWE